MCANPIIPNPPGEVKLFHICIDHELADLALELFSTTYGMDWQQAFEAARAMLSELIVYAYAWEEDYYENVMSEEVQP